MKFNRNPGLRTSMILHLIVFVVLFLVTLVEAFWPKEQPHVFEIVSEPLPNEKPQRNSASLEPLPDFVQPEVKPLEIPEPIATPTVPSKKPAKPPVEPAKPKEELITYDDFVKENPTKQPKTRKVQPSKPTIKVPIINTEKFSSNLESSLTTTDSNVTSQLTTAERTALQRYGDQLNRRLNSAWIKPENISGINLAATVVFDVNRSGRISNIRLRPGSGNADFDESVKAAFLRVGSGGATPTGQDHTFTMSFKIVN